MDMFALLVVPVLVGLGVGILSGMLGIGGGTVLVPIFRLLFGMEPVAATATSLFTIIPTSVSGALAHLRGKTCLPALGLALGLGGACTSPVGVWLASVSPGWAVMVAAALVIGWSAVNMFRKAWKMGKAAPAAGSADAGASGASAAPSEPGSPAGASETSRSATSLRSGASLLHAFDSDRNSVQRVSSAPAGLPGSEGSAALPCSASGRLFESAEAAAQAEKAAVSCAASAASSVPRFSRRQLLAGFGIGAAAGLLSGYVGVGGGFIMVPLMVSFLGIDMRRTSGTSLLAVMILALPGAVTQGVMGNIDWLVGVAVVVGSIPGAVVGTRLQRHVPERALRFLFGGFLIVGAVLLVVNEFAAFA